MVAPGQISATANPQVALYTVSPAAAGNVSVQFGLDTNYGLTTWTQPVPTGGGAVNLFVAGMKGNHAISHEGPGAVRRWVTVYGCGPDVYDGGRSHRAIASNYGHDNARNDAAERRRTIGFGRRRVRRLSPIAVTDLNGNVLWSYNPGLAGIVPNPIKLLPNGHFLMNYGNGSSDGQFSVLQRSGPNRGHNLANDRSGPQYGTGGSHMRWMQYHGCGNAPRFCDCFPTGT